MYLFDAQNRWGYESVMIASTIENWVYLFDAQNRWGYEGAQHTLCVLDVLRVSIRCSESLGL